MTDESNLVILLYHGVTDSLSQGIENFSSKHVPVEKFEKQMRTLKKRCVVLSMDEIVELTHKKKPWPRRAVAITFDDGFSNNEKIAAHILNELALPAVFYICSGMVNTDMMFWVDQIEDCINRCEQNELKIRLNEEIYLPLNKAADMIEAVKAVKNYCKQVSTEEKERVLRELRNITGVIPSVDNSPNYRMMSWDQVRQLDENPLFTIGGHTLYHEIMSAQPEFRMKEDIRLSMGLFRYHLGHEVIHYSYPEGQANHYSEGVIGALKEEGVVCSPSAIDGTNPPGTDLFHLKRTMVGFMGTPFPYEFSMGDDA